MFLMGSGSVTPLSLHLPESTCMRPGSKFRFSSVWFQRPSFCFTDRQTFGQQVPTGTERGRRCLQAEALPDYQPEWEGHGVLCVKPPFVGKFLRTPSAVCRNTQEWCRTQRTDRCSGDPAIQAFALFLACTGRGRRLGQNTSLSRVSIFPPVKRWSCIF